jgi:hypothetical protein
MAQQAAEQCLSDVIPSQEMTKIYARKGTPSNTSPSCKLTMLMVSFFTGFNFGQL